MRLMDLLLHQVERYGVMRASDAAKAAFDEAIAEVTAPGYTPDPEAQRLADKFMLRQCYRGMTWGVPQA